MLFGLKALAAIGALFRSQLLVNAIHVSAQMHCCTKLLSALFARVVADLVVHELLVQREVLPA